MGNNTTPSPIAALVADAITMTGAKPFQQMGNEAFPLWEIPGHPGHWQTATMVDMAINLAGIQAHADAVKAVKIVVEKE